MWARWLQERRFLKLSRMHEGSREGQLAEETLLRSLRSINNSFMGLREPWGGELQKMSLRVWV